MDAPWKVIFAFLGVFVAGAIFGGVFTRGAVVRRIANPPPERPLMQLPPSNQPRPQVAGPQVPAQMFPPAARPNPIIPQWMRRVEKRLNLTAEQQKKFRPIVGRAGEDLERMQQENERMRQENIAAIRRVTERMYADVSELLTMEQRMELEQLRKQEHERVQKDREKLQKEREKRQEAAALEAASRGATPAPVRPNDTTPPPSR